jgi:hypothetical protein
MLPCSNYMKIFLCATYKPSCFEEAGLVVQPCRSMCEHVHEHCFPAMDRFGMAWSSELNCSRFLDDSSEACMKDPGYARDTRAPDEYLKQIDVLLGKSISFEFCNQMVFGHLDLQEVMITIFKHWWDFYSCQPKKCWGEFFSELQIRIIKQPFFGKKILNNEPYYYD